MLNCDSLYFKLNSNNIANVKHIRWQWALFRLKFSTQCLSLEFRPCCFKTALTVMHHMLFQTCRALCFFSLFSSFEPNFQGCPLTKMRDKFLKIFKPVRSFKPSFERFWVKNGPVCSCSNNVGNLKDWSAI